MPNFRYLKERPGNPYRLGRHQVHDVLDAMPERRLEHVLDLAKSPKTVAHAAHQPVFNQGNLGSCTANAALRCLVLDPYWHEGVSFTEDDAVALYEMETKLDDSQIPGEYPPDDTGSTGPWSMMALEKQGKIATFFHTRSARTARVALNDGPISMGSVWLESMFNVDENGFIVVDRNSAAAGGHEYCVSAQNVDENWVEIDNSWDETWGRKGRARLHVPDFEWLFTQGADAVQPRLA